MDLQTKHPHRLAMLNAPYFTNKDCISTVMRDWQTCWQQSSQFNICSRMFGVATCRLTNVCSTNEDIAIFFNDKQTSVPCGNWNECTLLKPMAPPMLKCHWSHTHTHTHTLVLVLPSTARPPTHEKRSPLRLGLFAALPRSHLGRMPRW